MNFSLSDSDLERPLTCGSRGTKGFTRSSGFEKIDFELCFASVDMGLKKFANNKQNPTLKLPLQSECVLLKYSSC